MRKIVVLGVAGVALYAGTSNHGAARCQHCPRPGHRRHGDQLRPRPDRQALHLGRDRPGRVSTAPGLVMMAYQSAGVSVPHTSQDQWATEPHVSTPEPGDAVFFAGADGTSSAPGHEGLVIGPNR